MLRSHAVAPSLALWLMATLAAATAAAEIAPAGDPTAAAQAEASGAGPAWPPAEAPRWSMRSSLAQGRYASSLSRGRLDLGVRFETPVRSGRPGDEAIYSFAAYAPPLPILSIGLNSSPADGAATGGSLIERATGATARTSRDSKIGLEWKPAPSRLFLNRGLGIRLDGDDRVTMRLRKGSLGLFMQTNF